MYDIIIAGGGLSGSLCALTCASVGAKCVILEKGLFTDISVTDTRTTAINSGAIPLLTDLNIWSDLVVDAGVIRRIEVINGRGVCTFDDALNDLSPFGYIVDNYNFRRILLNAINNNSLITVIENAEIKSIRSDSVSITAIYQSDVRGQLLIAADGRNSRVRELAGIKTQVHNYSESAMVGQVRHDLPHNDTAFEVFLPRGPLALLPMQDPNMSAFVWSDKTENVIAFSKVSSELYEVAINQQFGDYLGRLQLIDMPKTWPLTRVLAENYVNGRVVLMGDAAHAIHPIAGQGLNLTFRDLVALRGEIGGRLSTGLTLFGALNSYSRLRSIDVRLMAHATHLLNALFLNNNPLLKVLRSSGLNILQKMPLLKQPLVKHATGVSRVAKLGF